MTDDQKDDLAIQLARVAVKIAGPDDAPGLLWQALIAVHLVHHSLESAVLCIGAGLEDIRRDVADMQSKRTIQ